MVPSNSCSCPVVSTKLINYTKFMRPNPYLTPVKSVHILTDYRARHSLSQRALADKLGVTPQVIWNTEAGLFTTIPVSIREYLAEHMEISPDQVQDEYYVWVMHQRHLNIPLFAYVETEHYPELKLSWIERWRDFKRQVQPPLVGSNTPSHRGFCVKLVYQPSVLTIYEKMNQGRHMLARALRQVGLDDSQLEDLKLPNNIK